MSIPGRPAATPRDAVWDQVERPWDVVVVGGGITGAGIFRELVRAGLRTLLVEQRDFAWGTSSRSSKLVHGGFRYLSQGHFRLVRAAARQRRRLLRDAPGLVSPIGFLLASYRGDRPPPWVNQAGLALYDLLASQWNHQRYDPAGLLALVPQVERSGLVAGLRGIEATTDDARLVLRLIQEAVAGGGVALNYAEAVALRYQEGLVAGVRLRDAAGDRHADVGARAVVNATGAWADRLRREVGAPPRMRPLRGSHLLFPARRFPLTQAVAFRHPLDRRYVSVVPWEDVAVVGTTDLDHGHPLDQEPRITPEEVAYLMAGVEAVFPSLALTLEDVVATFSGVRPVVDTGAREASRESRDHLVVAERGLVTVTGGKLTTFRLIAHDALRALRTRLSDLPPPDPSLPLLENASGMALDPSLDDQATSRLLGRFGAAAPTVAAAVEPGELEPVSGTRTLWAELRWGARAESVVHLDDLLLRRTRLGLFLPGGAAEILPRLRAFCQRELGWDDARWQGEVDRYLALWKEHYGLPDPALIPDWRDLLGKARAARANGAEGGIGRGLAATLGRAWTGLRGTSPRASETVEEQGR